MTPLLRRYFLIFVTITTALLAFRAQASVQLLPLKKGSYWVYEGTTRWTEPETGDVQERHVVWRMEVKDVIVRGAVTAALLEGHPQDLAFYDEDSHPGDYLILKAGDRYYCLWEDRIREVLSRLQDSDDPLDNLIEDDELFLESPLRVARSLGQGFFRKRKDHAYTWFVAQKQAVILGDLKGFSLQRPQMQYHLTYQTLPDDTHMDFIPGIGITRYRYTHHGMVAEADVRLIEYSGG